jgi:peptidoglycan/xylan/chitin deacetylase (PgdA/CDA1 family)
VAAVAAGTVSLTFDDGPDATWTPIILRELERLDARATFFVIAPLALANEHLIRAMRESGHGVELHCWHHERHSGSARVTVEHETDRALDELAAIGVRPSRWRTPWGDTAPWTAEVAAARGLSLTGWSVDSHDWRGDPAEVMMDLVRGDLGPGGVVLMHDGMGPGALRADCLQTMRLLAPLCRWTRSNGLRIAPLETVEEPAR